MKAAELRQSILQSAVQGKLLHQNPEDESACELFERIQKEKDRLIKEGKIKKAPPLPEITKNEIPFEIPENWCWVRLGQLTELITSGSRDWAKYYAPAGDVFLRMGNLSRDKFDLRLDKIQHVKLPKSIEGMRTSVQAGDLLFSITGEIGTLGLIPDNFGTAYINQHTAIIRFITYEKSKFYPYVLLSDYAQKFYSGNQHGIKNSFRLDTIALLPVPLPPLEEQRRIVSKVDELFSLCGELEAEEKKLDDLETHLTEYLPKSILQAAVQGKLVPQNSHDEPASELLKRIQQEKIQLVKEGKLKKEKPLPPISEDEIPYDLPEGWAWCRLGAISNYGNTQSVSTDEISADSWVLELEDVEKDTGKLLAQKRKSQRIPLSTKHRFQPNDILYSKLRPYLNKVLIAEEFGYCTSEILPLTFYKELNIKYTLNYLRSPLFVDYANRCSYGVKMPRLGTNDGKLALVPLPPIEEQKRIVAKVDELLALCSEMKAAYAEPVEFDEVAEIIPFSTSVASEHTEELEEPLLLAARGDAENLSSEALKAIDDLFAEDAE